MLTHTPRGHAHCTQDFSTHLPVQVDWRKDGSEAHFIYGAQEIDLLGELFQPHPSFVNMAVASRAETAGQAKVVGAEALATDNEAEHEVTARGGCVNPYFFSIVRGLLWSSSHLSALRGAYADAAGAHVLMPTPAIRTAVDAVLKTARSAGPRYVLGVHKRVATSGVAACQLTLRVPAMDEFIECARTALVNRARPPSSQPMDVTDATTDGAAGEAGEAMEAEAEAPFAGCAIVLATDDLAAPAAFAEACAAPSGRLAGATLVCRDGVKRTTGGNLPDGSLNEAHLLANAPSMREAVDALVDGLALSECDGMVHIDSSVAAFAALRNPDLELHNAGSLLPPSQQTTNEPPCKLRVIHRQGVFVRDLPTVASATRRMVAYGEVVAATGQWSGPWAAIPGGGWVLTDARNIDLDLAAPGTAPLGQLLERVPETFTHGHTRMPLDLLGVPEIPTVTRLPSPWASQAK